MPGGITWECLKRVLIEKEKTLQYYVQWNLTLLTLVVVEPHLVNLSSSRAIQVLVRVVILLTEDNFFTKTPEFKNDPLDNTGKICGYAIFILSLLSSSCQYWFEMHCGRSQRKDADSPVANYISFPGN